jgi:hypothetical protein
MGGFVYSRDCKSHTFALFRVFSCVCGCAFVCRHDRAYSTDMPANRFPISHTFAICSPVRPTRLMPHYCHKGAPTLPSIDPR